MSTEQAPVREAVPARPGSDVFISYSRRDRAVVERLAAALEARGRSAWVDFADIPPTAEWMVEIKGAIDAADTVVVVLSPDSVASPVCTEEIQAAVDANKRIAPVVVRDVAASDVPPELAKRNWLFLREDDDFEAGVNTLVTTLETDLDATPVPHRSARQGPGVGRGRGAEEPVSAAWLGPDRGRKATWPSPPGKETRPHAGADLVRARLAQGGHPASTLRRRDRRLRGAGGRHDGGVRLDPAERGDGQRTGSRCSAGDRRATAASAPRNRPPIARSQALAAASTASLSQETARAALLAIEAYATASTTEANPTPSRERAPATETWSERCACTRVACTRWTSVRTALIASAGDDGS